MPHALRLPRDPLAYHRLSPLKQASVNRWLKVRGITHTDVTAIDSVYGAWFSWPPQYIITTLVRDRQGKPIFDRRTRDHTSRVTAREVVAG